MVCNQPLKIAIDMCVGHIQDVSREYKLYNDDIRVECRARLINLIHEFEGLIQETYYHPRNVLNSNGELLKYIHNAAGVIKVFCELNFKDIKINSNKDILTVIVNIRNNITNKLKKMKYDSLGEFKFNEI